MVEFLIKYLKTLITSVSFCITLRIIFLRNTVVMKFIKSVILFLFATSLFIACSSEEKLKEESLTEGISEEDYEARQVREIFYNLYLPEEMSRIFDQVGANFNPDYVISPENFSSYQDPVDIAVAIGAYGVDLSYAKLFDQKALTASYFSVVEILSEKLGIPKDYYEDLFKRIREEDPTDRDTISTIASRIYQKTDDYLTANGQSASAAQIVMGGWIEALYIASRIYKTNPSNMEIFDRISEQKYSLNSLIYRLSNHQYDLVNVRYLLYLKKLKKVFDRYEIYFEEEDFRVDTANRLIIATDYESDMTEEMAMEIVDLIAEIRGKIMN
jgi:hypothetical protein